MKLACSLVIVARASASAGAPSSYRGEVQVTHVEVEPRIAAPVKRVVIRDGQVVAKGDLLVELDDTAARAHIATAEVQRVTRQHELVTAEAALEHAAADRRDLVQANLDLARARVHAADAELDLARLELGYTSIKAEISGLVTLRAFGTTVERFHAIAAIDDIDHAWVVGFFTEPQVATIALGQRADVAIAKLALHGTVAEIQTEDAALVHAYVDTGAAGSARVGVGVKIGLDRHDRSLRQGMAAIVTIHTN